MVESRSRWPAGGREGVSTVTLRAGPGGKAPVSGHCEAHERLVSGLGAIFLQRSGGYIQTWGRPSEAGGGYL